MPAFFVALTHHGLQVAKLRFCLHETTGDGGYKCAEPGIDTQAFFQGVGADDLHFDVGQRYNG